MTGFPYELFERLLAASSRSTDLKHVGGRDGST